MNESITHLILKYAFNSFDLWLFIFLRLRFSQFWSLIAGSTSIYTMQLIEMTRNCSHHGGTYQ